MFIFQGFLETEIYFYSKFVPELSRLGAPLPLLYPLVHSDYISMNREILLLDDLQSKGFYAIQREHVCNDGDIFLHGLFLAGSVPIFGHCIFVQSWDRIFCMYSNKILFPDQIIIFQENGFWKFTQPQMLLVHATLTSLSRHGFVPRDPRGRMAGQTARLQLSLLSP